MTPDQFRTLALSQPQAIESSHMGTVDFRVGGKIFATLNDAKATAVLKLTREQQEIMVAAEPALFAAVKGGWGMKGWTVMTLGDSDEATLRGALGTAWRNIAPARLRAAAAAGAPG